MLKEQMILALFDKFAFGDIRAYRHISLRATIIIQKRDDSSIHPIYAAVFSAVAYFSAPYFSG
jgi:hypothetical protein